MARCINCHDEEEPLSELRKKEIYITHSVSVPFYFRQETGIDIVLFLSILKQDILLGRDADWGTLYQVFKGLNFAKEMSPYSISFLMEISMFLERYTCKNMNVMLHIFRIIHYATCIPQMERQEYSIDMLELLENRYILDKHYGGITPAEYMDFPWWASYHANVGLLKRMLKFGMRMVCSDNLKIISRFMKTIKVGLLRLFIPEVVYINSIECKRFLRKISSSCNGDQRIRFAIMIKALVILTKILTIPRSSENYAICYKLMFDSVEWPYISSTEVRIFLQNYLPESYHHRIPEVLETIKKFLPDVTEPRSLKHLCRVQIRASLCQNSNLPYGVPSLKLPNPLKRYILLDDDCDYSNLTIWEDNTMYDPKPRLHLDTEDSLLTYIRSL